MSISHSPSADSPDNARLRDLVAKLQTFRSSGLRAYWRVYFAALCYAFIAWQTGKDFLLLYLGLLVVIFLLHEMSVRRVERQLDSVIETLQRLQEEKREET